MPEAAAAVPRGRVRAQLHRMASGHIAVSTIFVVVLVIALVALDAGVFLANNPAILSSPHYYLALGNSISFGYQPNLDFADGYVDDVFADLRQQNRGTELVNYACAGETTTTMIQGNCPLHLIHHNAYSGPQLDAAVSFLKSRSSRVAPVTLDIGSNDVLPDWNSSTCLPGPNATTDLATMDANLTQTILPRLTAALTPVVGSTSPSFLLLNYYNPYAQSCTDSPTFVHELNDHLAADAAQFHIPVVDVYSAFGGDEHTAGHLCSYTWVCDASMQHDFHPTTEGYHVIAQAVEQALGIPVVQNAGPARARPVGRSRPRDLWQHTL